MLEPQSSLFGMNGRGITRKMLLCAFFWFVGLMIGGMAMEAASRR